MLSNRVRKSRWAKRSDAESELGSDFKKNLNLQKAAIIHTKPDCRSRLAHTFPERVPPKGQTPQNRLDCVARVHGVPLESRPIKRSRKEGGDLGVMNARRRTLLRLPKPILWMADVFHSGSGGTNCTAGGCCFSTPSGKVHSTASHLYMKVWVVERVLTAITSQPEDRRGSVSHASDIRTHTHTHTQSCERTRSRIPDLPHGCV